MSALFSVSLDFSSFLIKVSSVILDGLPLELLLVCLSIAISPLSGGVT
jgi:hypothetical protein